MHDQQPANPASSTPAPAPSSADARDRRGLFLLLLGVLWCVSPWGSPQVGLLLGVVIALLGLNAYAKRTRKISRVLIQVCIVIMGLKTDLAQVQRAGLSGVGFAAGTIAGAFVLGLTLARLLRVDGRLATLLCTGTAICGGSAIAATSSVIRAREEHTTIALACVFLLNAVALWAFPPIGHALDLSQHQFGAWAAIAIHDVASVVGAGKAYGEVALQDATVIKLARVLWIVPIAALAGWWWRRHDRLAATHNPSDTLTQNPLPEGGGRGWADKAKQVELASTSGAMSPSTLAVAPSKRNLLLAGMGDLVPWFIIAFLAASTLRTFVPTLAQLKPRLDYLTTAGMSTALLLIGTGLSMKAVREVGWRALLMASLLWVSLSVVALLVVRQTVQ